MFLQTGLGSFSIAPCGWYCGSIFATFSGLSCESCWSQRPEKNARNEIMPNKVVFFVRQVSNTRVHAPGHRRLLWEPIVGCPVHRVVLGVARLTYLLLLRLLI